MKYVLHSNLDKYTFLMPDSTRTTFRFLRIFGIPHQNVQSGESQLLAPCPLVSYFPPAPFCIVNFTGSHAC